MGIHTGNVSFFLFNFSYPVLYQNNLHSGNTSYDFFVCRDFFFLLYSSPLKIDL